MNKSLLAGCTAVLMTIGSFAAAQQDQPTFEELDGNQDGVLTAQELRSVVPGIDSQVADPDTAVTVSDVQAVMPEIEFAEDVNRYAPLGAEEYQMLVDAIYEQHLAEALSNS